MSLSIIIVNYKTPTLVVDCIQSITDHDCYRDYEIIVVDNHSSDNSEGMLKARFPETRFIQMGSNSGFARANNEGIRQAKGRYSCY
ncbi:glycosyltransferase family 2 protein [Paraflavitalea speifideaquila]|uniref:glycosyltransferase family 2 protein n=1 Tax=Paraflavitalea speifideaquila TaxID=3076558 RepID=UPI0028F06B51|nr:glycosyltransferase [Paraflavitalea speifideiaquila]